MSWPLTHIWISAVRDPYKQELRIRMFCGHVDRYAVPPASIRMPTRDEATCNECINQYETDQLERQYEEALDAMSKEDQS